MQLILEVTDKSLFLKIDTIISWALLFVIIANMLRITAKMRERLTFRKKFQKKPVRMLDLFMYHNHKSTAKISFYFNEEVM